MVQVEQELAKRSHFSQKLIKKLSTRVKELEDQQEQQSQQEEPKEEPIKKANSDNFDELVGNHTFIYNIGSSVGEQDITVGAQDSQTKQRQRYPEERELPPPNQTRCHKDGRE